MAFVHGPEGVTFPDDKPAKLRFFLGYVDELSPVGDGSDQVIFVFTLQKKTSTDNSSGLGWLFPFTINKTKHYSPKNVSIPCGIIDYLLRYTQVACCSPECTPGQGWIRGDAEGFLSLG